MDKTEIRKENLRYLSENGFNEPRVIRERGARILFEIKNHDRSMGWIVLDDVKLTKHGLRLLKHFTFCNLRVGSTREKLQNNLMNIKNIENMMTFEEEFLILMGHDISIESKKHNIATWAMSIDQECEKPQVYVDMIIYIDATNFIVDEKENEK